MAKANTQYKSCAYCAKRTTCWNTERYGDRGERGKRPYPTDTTCLSFKADEKMELR